MENFIGELQGDIFKTWNSELVYSYLSKKTNKKSLEKHLGEKNYAREAK